MLPRSRDTGSAVPRAGPFPQVYWNIGFAAADYAILVPWWSEVVMSRVVADHCPTRVRTP
jgi:hypothetical protein